MTNFIKATNFRIKDSLVTGDPNKRIKGAEIDDEFNAIATAIASKSDSASPAFSGTPTAPTAPNGNNSTQIATTAFVFSNSVPIGAILMWSGTIATIPAGYALCNGSGGTPDLRNRFIIGAGDTYATGTTGGSADAVVVSHTHTIVDNGHSHALPLTPPFAGTGGNVGSGLVPQGSGLTSSSATTGITVNTTGESGVGRNLPPFFALAFIQRVS